MPKQSAARMGFDILTNDPRIKNGDTYKNMMGLLNSTGLSTHEALTHIARRNAMPKNVDDGGSKQRLEKLEEKCETTTTK